MHGAWEHSRTIPDSMRVRHIIKHRQVILYLIDISCKIQLYRPRVTKTSKHSFERAYIINYDYNNIVQVHQKWQAANLFPLNRC